MARLRWASGIALIALTVTACGMGGGNSDNGGSGDGEGSGGGNIVYDEFTPPLAAWAPETDDGILLSRAGCLETLLKYEADGTLSENLATAWEQVKPKTWEFTLREGVEFQDGTPMDADAVVGALQHVLDAKTPGPFVQPRRRVRREGRRRLHRGRHHPGARRAAAVADGQPEHRDPGAEGLRRASRSTSRAPAPDPSRWSTRRPRQSLSLERNENYWGGDVADRDGRGPVHRRRSHPGHPAPDGRGPDRGRDPGGLARDPRG